MKKSIQLICILFVFASCAKNKKMDSAAESIRDFVIHISQKAKTIQPNFIIIPQNGVEIAFNNQEISEGLNQNYLNAIDGIGVEVLFYNENYNLNQDRVNQLRQLVTDKKILVSEYVKEIGDVTHAVQLNQQEGFVCFPRTSTNYHYLEIPSNVINENSNDISTLSQIQNYLYLINSDGHSSKQAFLQAITATNFDLVLIDLFYDGSPFSLAEINQLKVKANGGRRLVIAYMNIGSAETFRYYWQSNWGLHRPNWIKKKYDGYKDEFWVKFWHSDWQKIIYQTDDSYLNKVIAAGFDGAYLDNIEAYYFLYKNK